MLALVAVSGVSLFFNFDEIFTPDNQMKKSTGALMVGNVEVVKRDGSGNIVAYRQGDNHIVLGGMELIARQVFGSGGGNNTNTSSVDLGGGFNYGGGLVRFMSIGNGSAMGNCVTPGAPPTPQLGFNNMTLECPLFDINPGSPCLREIALINRENATENPQTVDQAQLNLTAVATFSGAVPNSCAAQNIGEAGIWQNQTVTPAVGPGFYAPMTPLADNVMFARNTFGTVNLSTSDSLELTWKFTFTDS